MNIFDFIRKSLELDRLSRQPGMSLEERLVENSAVNNVYVRTVRTLEGPFETAIICENGIHPVERYATREDAYNGHIDWCLRAKTITHVIRIIDGLDDELVEIKRYDKLPEGDPLRA